MWYRQANKLFLDDIRTPDYVGWDSSAPIVKTSKEAIEYVMTQGCPEYISFDHDLGGEDTAMVFVKWLVDYDMDNNSQIIPQNFDFNVHSANPSGAANIKSYLKNYLNFREN